MRAIYSIEYKSDMEIPNALSTVFDYQTIIFEFALYVYRAIMTRIAETFQVIGAISFRTLRIRPVHTLGLR